MITGDDGATLFIEESAMSYLKVTAAIVANEDLRLRRVAAASRLVPKRVAARLAEKYGKQCLTLFMPGASGDINPGGGIAGYRFKYIYLEEYCHSNICQGILLKNIQFHFTGYLLKRYL